MLLIYEHILLILSSKPLPAPSTFCPHHDHPNGSYLLFCSFRLSLGNRKSLQIYLPDSNLHSSHSDYLKIQTRSHEFARPTKASLGLKFRCPPRFCTGCVHWPWPARRPHLLPLSSLLTSVQPKHADISSAPELDRLLPAWNFGAGFP